MSVMYIILEGDVCDGGRQYVYVVVYLMIYVVRTVCGGRAWWGWYYVVGVVGSGGDCMWWGWYMWWGWGWVVPRGRVLLHLVLDPHGRLWGSDALVVEGEGWIEGWIEGDY